MTTPITQSHRRLERVRGMLAGLFGLGCIVVGVELLLLGHTEDFWQWVPVALLATGIVAVSWLAAWPTAGAVHAMRGLAILFVISGAIGLYQHYSGNVEFELEMYPSMGGFQLVREALTGATPALAPGTMIGLGILGLIVTVHHPLLNASRDTRGTIKEH